MNRGTPFLLLAALLAWTSVRADFEVYFLRHGETPWNRAKLLQGSVSHVDLTEKGVRMAEATAAGLKREGIAFDRVFYDPVAFDRKADPVKVIFDTDMYTDFDDAGALACLHALADAGECEILATLANTRESMSVAMCEIINAYYGRPDIPVGCVRQIGLGNDRSGEHRKRYGAVVEKYAKWVKHLDSDAAPDAADVYRRVLSAQPDQSVVICSVGFLTNMRKLMETDRELVVRKVKRWVAMACSYPKGREYNSMLDWESSKIALERWPTPIVFTDFQYGRTCYAGRKLAESAVEGNPVADVFRQNVAACNGAAGRSAWDETAVLIAVRGIEPYFGCERGTYRMVGDKGDDEWRPDPTGRDCRVTETISKTEIGRVIDHLMMQPPKRR